MNNLTKREIEVVECLSDGLTYAEIANKLDIAVNTVKVYASRIYSKLNISGKNDLQNYNQNSSLLATVYVPSTLQGSTPISERDFKKRVKSVATFFATLEGGATVNGESFGSWLSIENNDLIGEKVVKVECIISVKNENIVKNQVMIWSRKWLQESVLFTVHPVTAHFL